MKRASRVVKGVQSRLQAHVKKVSRGCQESGKWCQNISRGCQEGVKRVPRTHSLSEPGLLVKRFNVLRGCLNYVKSCEEGVKGMSRRRQEL